MTPERASESWQLTWGASLIFLTVLLVQILRVLAATDGTFTYALDDAYIHFALVENLARGEYGFNASEHASPASSILWPFLLLPFRAVGLLTWGPLVINVAASLVAIRVIERVLVLILADAAPRYRTERLLATCALVFGFNLPGLTLMGMEHTLQLTASLLIAYGLLLTVSHRITPNWLWWVMIAAPMLRYESLAVSGVALLILLGRGEWKKSIMSGAAIAAVLGAFSYYLHTLGLPLLPLSVSAKMYHVRYVFLAFSPTAIVLTITLILALWAGIRAQQHDERILAFAAALIAAVHTVFSVTSLRYEAYVYGFAVPILLYVCRAVIADFLARGTVLAVRLRILLIILCLFIPYVQFTVRDVAAAARNIYEMHWTMHRFVVDYLKAPVAVNDIGRVKFENSDYVLDLVGLANFRSYTLNRGVIDKPNREWMQTLLTERNIDYAMIFELWYRRQLPPHWIKVAELELAGRNVILPQDRTSFFATSPAAAKRLTETLKIFAAENHEIAKRLIFTDKRIQNGTPR